MTVAQIFQALAITVCLLIDGILTSKYLGRNATAAFGMAGALITLFVAAGGTIASGGQVLCGKALGSGDKAKANASFSSAAAMGVIVSAACLVTVLLFADPISVAMGAVKGTEVQFLTRDYLKGYIIGCPGAVLMQTINPFLHLIGKKRVVLTGVGVMIFTDICGDLLNIFVFHWGTFGMGLATAMSYYAAFLVSLICILRNRSSFRFCLQSLELSCMKKILLLGSTYAVYQICRGFFKVAVNNILMRSGGESLVAVYSVINIVYTICLSAGMGIAATVLLMSGVCYGEGDRGGLDDLLRVMIRHVLILNTVLAAIMILFANPIISLFSCDPSIRSDCVTGLRIIIVGIIPFSFGSSMRSFYQGVHRIMVSQIICVLQNFVFGILMVFLTISILHSTFAPWIGIAGGEALIVLLILTLCSIKNHHLTTSVSELNLADSSAVYMKAEAEYEIHSGEEAIEAASGIQNTCRRLGISDRDGMALAMCIEELAVNTFKHGADPVENRVSVEIVLRRSRDGYVLTQTDNAALFDPVRYDELHQEDSGHVGIRNVRKLSKDMSYINLFGLNRIAMRI